MIQRQPRTEWGDLLVWMAFVLLLTFAYAFTKEWRRIVAETRAELIGVEQGVE